MLYNISYVHPVYGKQSVKLSLTRGFYLNHSSQSCWRCLSNEVTPYGSHICKYVCSLPHEREELHVLLEIYSEPCILSLSLYRTELIEGTDTYRLFVDFGISYHIRQLK